MRATAALLAIVMVVGFGWPAAAEQVEIRHGETKLPATLYRPKGDGPHPAVVALHGCGGLADSKGNLYPQYQAWADHLMGAGFAVLFPDSFAGRGMSAQCRVQTRAVRSWRERVAEVTCTAARGEALLMRPLILHASGRSTSPRHRRVLHIEYAAFPLPSGLHWHEAA